MPIGELGRNFEDGAVIFLENDLRGEIINIMFRVSCFELRSKSGKNHQKPKT